MRVLLDCDGVLGHFTAGALAWVKARHGRALTDESITDFNIMRSWGLDSEWPAFTQWMSDTRFCREMPVYDGAREFVDKLRGRAEVLIVTSPFVGVEHWEADRRDWLARHFRFDKSEVISCERKDIVAGDWLVDDRTENCRRFELSTVLSGADSPRAICFDRPWNQDFLGIRAHSYDEVLSLISA